MKLSEIKLVEATATASGVQAIKQFLDEVFESNLWDDFKTWAEGGNDVVLSHASTEVYTNVIPAGEHYIMQVSVVGTDLGEYEPGDRGLNGQPIDGDEPTEIMINLLIPASFAVSVAISAVEDTEELYHQLTDVAKASTTTIHKVFKKTKYWERNGFDQQRGDDDEFGDDMKLSELRYNPLKQQKGGWYRDVPAGTAGAVPKWEQDKRHWDI